jgi:predicted O-methyltransferase YrrM
MYRFDHDWFSNNIPNLTRLFAGFKGDKPPRILEIGAFEGRSTVWFLDNVPGCHVTTIDTWKGGKDHDPENPEIDWKTVEENFKHNIKDFGTRVSVYPTSSFQALSNMVKNRSSFFEFHFDFVYVDGSHTAADVNLDLILSFKLLNVGGLIYCDDYLWGFNEFPVYDCPKLGIDSFVNVYADKLMPLQGFTNNAAIYMKVKE